MFTLYTPYESHFDSSNPTGILDVMQNKCEQALHVLKFTATYKQHSDFYLLSIARSTFLYFPLFHLNCASCCSTCCLYTRKPFVYDKRAYVNNQFLLVWFNLLHNVNNVVPVNVLKIIVYNLCVMAGSQCKQKQVQNRVKVYLILCPPVHLIWLLVVTQAIVNLATKAILLIIMYYTTQVYLLYSVPKMKEISVS